jgi:hypothetical protein
MIHPNREEPDMAESRSPFLATIVGPPEFERYVLKRNFIEPPDYFTGNTEEVWTDDLRKARKYASLGDLGHDLHELAIRELNHLPQAKYRLEVEITAIGDATPEQVREYLFDALTIGLDYENHGPGPGIGSLILLKTDTTSLKAEDDFHQTPRNL